MSRFQQMKRQQAQAAAAANKAGKPGKATIEEETPSLVPTLSSTSSPSSSIFPSSSSASSSSSSSLNHLTSLYPLPSTKEVARRRWNVDQAFSSSSSSSSLTSSLLSSKDLTFPSGFLSGDHSDSSSAASTPASLSKTADLVYASAQNTALAPGKQLLMTAFMLWMSGNSLQIFSIMMLGMALWQPLQKMLNVQAEFARYEGSQVDVRLPKLLFMACNLLGIALALYKANSMGLLPTSSADWLSTAVRPVVEFSGGGWS